MRGLGVAFLVWVAMASPSAAQVPLSSELAPKNVLSLSAGASYDQGGVNLGLGFRHDFGRLMLGVYGEYNPWFSLLSASVQTGAANAYVGVGLRWYTSYAVELRSSLGAGGTVLLFEEGGPHAGDLGLFLSGSVLSAAVRLSPRWRLEIKPDAAVMIPQLHGTPLVYHEYRLSFSFERRL